RLSHTYITQITLSAQRDALKGVFRARRDLPVMYVRDKATAGADYFPLISTTSLSCAPRANATRPSRETAPARMISEFGGVIGRKAFSFAGRIMMTDLP